MIVLKSLEVNDMKSKLMIWICRRLPKNIIYFCANQLLADISTSVMSDKEVPKIAFVDAMQAYIDKYKI